MTKAMAPVPPGEILNEEFMRPLAISQNKLAPDLDVPLPADPPCGGIV